LTINKFVILSIAKDLVCHPEHREGPPAIILPAKDFDNHTSPLTGAFLIKKNLEKNLENVCKFKKSVYLCIRLFTGAKK